MSYSITRYGKPLDKSKYVIDEKNKTFSSKEDYLILDFGNLDGWSFKTGVDCSFHTGSYCIFSTGWNCTFKTGGNCTFIANSNCNFTTGPRCIFTTGFGCTFETFQCCTFYTHWNCTFNTGSDCIFNTGEDCIFHIGNNCTLNILSNFYKIKTKGNSIVLIKDRGIHDYSEDEVEIYFNKKNNEILYTKKKWNRDKYKMMKELMK